MARVSLIDPKNRPDLSGLIAKITGARGGRLINVYRMLLHTPVVTEAWLNFISSLRTGTEIDERTKELVIMRVAILNRVDYVLRTHVQIYALKAGVSQEQIDTLPDWQASRHFNDCDRALLAYVDAMTRVVDVSDAVFAALRSHYSERQVVEITVLIGTYNMHTRVLQALRIDPEPASSPS